MSVVGFRDRPATRIHEIDNWATTPEVFAPLQARFSFTVDAAASHENAKCARYWTVADDGLRWPWAGERVFINPPFSNIGPWVRKAWAEIGAHLVVMLAPANRTEQEWWQRLIEPFRDQADGYLRTEFMPRRPQFLEPGQAEVRRGGRSPFGLCLLIWPGQHHDLPAVTWNRDGLPDLFGGAA